MSTIQYIQNNAFCITLLLIMFFSSRGGSYSKDDQEQSLFNFLIFSTISILVFDTVSLAIDGKIFPHSRSINYISNILFFICNTLPCLAWFCYAHFKIYNDKQLLKRRFFLYSIPVLINAVFVLISMKTNWIFSITPDNIYHRGPLITFNLVWSYCYFIGVVILVIKFYKSIPKQLAWYLVLFPVPLMLCNIIQIMFYGLSLAGIGFVISIFLSFIKMQNKSLYHDPLTGVYNRKYLKNLSKNGPVLKSAKNTQGFFLLLDIDDFKHINDTYGHMEGDKILKDLAMILVNSCDKDHEVYRFGGDEFIIIGACDTKEHMQDMEIKIRNNINYYNTMNNQAYKLEVSIGSIMFDTNNKQKYYDIIQDADKIMYKEKARKKQVRQD